MKNTDILCNSTLIAYCCLINIHYGIYGIIEKDLCRCPMKAADLKVARRKKKRALKFGYEIKQGRRHRSPVLQSKKKKGKQRKKKKEFQSSNYEKAVTKVKLLLFQPF